ncbi:MAG: hypothetical protein QGH25_23865 [Candidatus Latescibacteria bacterium]|nr:hypothetical protein [Candidatus Latescibacterota bacterium]
MPTSSLSNPVGAANAIKKQLEQWTFSPMANAGINTWVYDIYSGDGSAGGMGGIFYLRDSAHARDNPASECAACVRPTNLS